MGLKKSMRWLVMSCMALLSGCATNSLFSPYPTQVAEIKQQIAAGDFAAARKALEKKSQGPDKMLYLMERGRIAQIAGDTEASIQDFEQVLAEFEAKEEAAKISATGAAGKAGAVLLNENAIPYAGSAYERIFVHSFQALNYLWADNLEAAGVEARRANLEQQLALQANEDEVERAEAQESAEETVILQQNPDYRRKFSSLTRLSSKVKNAIQNGYSFYLSGLIYEISGEYNDAYIDYKKALEIYPTNHYLRQDVLRLARKLGMDEDLERFSQVEVREDVARSAKDEGRLVVLYEQGYVPEKHEVNIVVDLRGVPNNLVFPTYFDRARPNRPLVIGLSGRRLGETETIAEPAAMAARELEEQLTGMIVRQGLRAIAREQLKDNQMNSTFGILAGIGQLLLNRADLRSWLTLPAEVQLLDAMVSAGKQRLTLRNGVQSKAITVDVQPGRITIVHVIAVSGQLHARTITI
ncbi:MAG TPA: hypothetical protein ENJ13_03165 [Chromatiales bacterium]|nr:hypothetical protein [Chromatiales bacterium]